MVGNVAFLRMMLAGQPRATPFGVHPHAPLAELCGATPGNSDELTAGLLGVGWVKQVFSVRISGI